MALPAFRRVAAGEVRTPPTFEGQVFKRLALRLPVEIIRHRNFVALDTATRVLVPNRDDAIQIGKFEGLQNQRIDGAEDGAVRADAEGERDHGNRREARALDQVANRITDITEERTHVRLPFHSGRVRTESGSDPIKIERRFND